MLVFNVILSYAGVGTSAKAATNDAIEGLTGFELSYTDSERNKKDAVTSLDDIIQAAYQFEFGNLDVDKTITFKLPAQLKVIQTYTNEEITNSNGKVIGKFTLAADGTVTLTAYKGRDVKINFNAESTMKPGTPIESNTTEIVYGSQKAELVVDFEQGKAISKAVTKVNDTTYKWTIDVNTELSKLTNAVVKDAIPQGLEATNVKVSELSVALNAGDKLSFIAGKDVSDTVTSKDPVTVTLGDTSKAYRIEITTNKVDNKLIANYVNTATLKAIIDGKETTLGSDYEDISIKNSYSDTRKSVVETDFKNRVVTYEIKVTIPEDGSKFSVKDTPVDNGSITNLQLVNVKKDGVIFKDASMK